jgi:hypothetical protein
LKFVNCTSHIVRIADKDDNIILESQPSGIWVRAQACATIIKIVDGVPLITLSYGTIFGLPDPEDDILYIVSRIVFHHPDIQHRYDLVVPDGGYNCLVKDGRIYAARRFLTRASE